MGDVMGFLNKFGVCWVYVVFVLYGFYDDGGGLFGYGGLQFVEVVVGYEVYVFVVYGVVEWFVVFWFLGKGQCVQVVV